MRKIYLLFVFTCALFFAQGQSTAKPDVILKVNGDELHGKVTEIGDSTLKFIYEGETLVYTINKKDILKITFASGRVQTFNKPALPSENTVPANNTNTANASAPAGVTYSTQEHRNKIAILPFGYLIDKQDAGEEISYHVQSDAFTMLNGHTGVMTIQDLATTNALLIRSGITQATIRGFTNEELCNVLGVEYVIRGVVTQNKKAVINSQYTNGTVNTTNSNNNKTTTPATNKATVNAYSSSTSRQDYTTTVTMNIFNDKGANIYSQNRESFWSDNDAYKVTLQYLLKRVPLYTK